MLVGQSGMVFGQLVRLVYHVVDIMSGKVYNWGRDKSPPLPSRFRRLGCDRIPGGFFMTVGHRQPPPLPCRVLAP